MKKYLYLLFTAAIVLFAAGCSNDDDGPNGVNSGVVGEWHLTQWSQQEPRDFDVWIELLSDGTFQTFERVETSAYVKFYGDYAVDGARLSGRYHTGETWSYAFELSSDGNTLTMTTDKASEVNVYTRTKIPAEVRDVHEVRSALPAAFRPFL